MKIAILVVMAALPALAQAPSFRSSAALTLEGKDALHRVALPFEAYRDARRDLADVRVLNGRGEPVPIAWAGAPDTVREAPPAIELPAFPLTHLEPPAGKGVAEVTVRATDGTLVWVRPKDAGEPRAVAYLVDASQVNAPIAALVFDWKMGAGTEVVALRVEASDDLKAWTAVTTAPVVHVEAVGRSLKQPRVEFTPRQAKYFRITWDTGAFVLEGVRAEPEHSGTPPARALRTVTAATGAKEGEYLFDLGARLPVEAVRIVPAGVNAVVSASLYTREDEGGEWRLLTAAPFYKLQRDGAEVQSPPVEVGRHSARYWMARLAKGSSGGPPPVLEAHWRGAQLVFVARGDPPFSIAFGRPAATASTLPVSSLIPDYKRLAELRLAQARVGAVVSGPPPTQWEQLVGELNTRRVVLWAILLAGVAALAFMAWRLHRQMR